MRFIDLNPKWLGAGGPDIYESEYHYKLGIPRPERYGIGVAFDCPCGCGMPSMIEFANPLDGKPPYRTDVALWQRTGETFETLTITPSILRKRERGGCGWHGFITNGEVTGRVES
jgi:hypothetical protein